MTPILFPLMIVLSSLEISGGEPAAGESAPAGVETIAEVGSLASGSSAATLDAFASPWSYPDEFTWNRDDQRAGPAGAEDKIRFLGFDTQGLELAPVFADPGRDATDEFDLTTGGELVGIGFRWRFR
jgi:hypothetical protein